MRYLFTLLLAATFFISCNDVKKGDNQLVTTSIAELRKHLKDPKSLDTLQTSIADTKDSGKVVFIKYRATNSLGAYIQNEARFFFDKNNQLIPDIGTPGDY